jgi:hypothetical protein
MGLYDNPESLKNNEGFKLLKSGSKSKGLELLREAALNGQPNSLATIIWHYMLEGDIKKAIKRRHRQQLINCIFYQESYII